MIKTMNFKKISTIRFNEKYKKMYTLECQPNNQILIMFGRI